MKKVTFQPIDETLEVRTGTDLLNALLSKELDVPMACGGNGLCATCHVFIREGSDRLTPRTNRETKTLSYITGVDATSRLACQTRIIGEGVVVKLPEGMYIERAEDLMSLLGTRAKTNILHPINGSTLLAKGKIITRTLLEELKDLNVEVERVRNSG